MALQLGFWNDFWIIRFRISSRIRKYQKVRSPKIPKTLTVTERLTWEISQTLFRSSYRSKSWDGIKDKLCKLFQLIGVLIICSVSKFWMYLFQQSKEKAEHGQHELGRWDQRRRQHPSIQLQKQSFIPGMATRTNFFCFVFRQAFLDISKKTQGQKNSSK